PISWRIIRDDKRVHIDNLNPPMLERVNISPENWLKLTTRFTRVFHGAVGRPTSQIGYCENLNRKRRANISNCEKLLA
ncbi:transposase, partial [Pseudoalteromonas sp. S3776]